METSSLAIFTQWLIFVATIAAVIVPAFVFRNIALKVNKKGWLYFVAGMGTGLLCLPLSRFVAFGMMEYDVLPSNGSYAFGLITFLVIPAMVVTLAVIVVGRRVGRMG